MQKLPLLHKKAHFIANKTSFYYVTEHINKICGSFLFAYEKFNLAFRLTVQHLKTGAGTNLRQIKPPAAM